VRVAFSGEGADELFGGYYWSYLHPLGLADRIRERAKSFGVEDDLGELISEVFPCPEDERTYQLNVFDLLMKSGLANYHLWSVDRSGSAFGFEIRPPYLTYELADFALSLPVEYKVGHQETKRILRAAAAPLFEEYGISPILSRPKVGMPAAIELVGRQVDDFATRLLYSSEGRHLGAARLVAMGHPFARFLRNPLEVILFDLFYRIFIEHRGRLPAGVGVRDFYS
ncbi:MAG TPA: asparagine synthase, partial [Firmicutes bacterium]|nr:asparagine synthase [Bacillota bacterium]